jgi:hypothetical protein
MESDELIVQSQHWPDGSIIKKHKITVLFTSSSIEKKQFSRVSRLTMSMKGSSLAYAMNSPV